jgi:hypothetical protein
MGQFTRKQAEVHNMQTWKSQGLAYGVQVGMVLATVASGLLASWHASAHGWSVDGPQTEQALMALGVALIVGLRAMARVDRSLG